MIMALICVGRMSASLPTWGTVTVARCRWLDSGGRAETLVDDTYAPEVRHAV